MSKNNPLLGQIAALVMELGAGKDYPEGCNAHILPDGVFRSDDGRPASLTNGELRDWQMNAEIAAKLIADLEASGKPILYDYEHNSLWGDSEAAGWIKRLVYVAGRGLFAYVEWVDDAAEAIAKKKYLYSSPCFLFDPKTGAVVKLLSVALTNNPALGDLGAVSLARRAALSALPVGALANLFFTAGGVPGNSLGDQDMTPEQIAALSSENGTLKTQVTTLTGENTTLKTQVAALSQEKADAVAAADKAKREDMIQSALTAGTLAPAQKEFAESLDTAALSKFMETLKPLAILGRQVDGKDAGGHGLTPDELAMCSKMGVSPEDFKKAKTPA